MKRIYGEELKQIQLDILDHVKSFCEENHISYWIDSGTLLGAIRHKGYIPWDDDIDVGMLRADYDRFCKAFNKTDDQRYRLVCLENTPGFYIPFAKVCDTETVLYEPDENGRRLSINIDIFVYDNAPDDDRELKKMYNIRDRLRRMYLIKAWPISRNENFFIRMLKHSCRMVCRPIYPKKNFIQAMIDNSKKYSCAETARVGNFTAFTRMACSKRVFDSFVDVEFEGKLYKAPVGYDEWLRSFYGDYMQLPPEEKRITHHRFVAYAMNGGEANETLSHQGKENSLCEK